MRLLLVILVLLALCLPVFAETESGLGIETDSLTDELPSEAAEQLTQDMLTGGTDFWTGFRQLFFGALDDSRDSLQSGLRLCAILLAILTLCAMARMHGALEGTTAVTLAGALGLTAAVLTNLQSMVSLASETVRSVTDYSACLLPVLASAAAMSGGMTSATALYAGTVLFSQLLMQLISKLLIPAVFFYIAIATAEAALSSEMLSELRSFVGWLVSKSLRILMYIFLAYMSITGVISASADAAAVKATKAAVSGMVPVVGGILSDASDTLLASASILKNSVGVFGMLAVLAICLAPFLRVGVQYLLLKLTAAVGGAVGDKPLVQLVRHFSTAMGFLLGMCGACSLLLLISMVCFLKVVV